MFIPSVQQQALFDWIVNGEGSVILEAVAGSGKTTTLIEAINLMAGKIFFGAYNKKISDEIQKRLPKGSTAKVSTMHAAGLGFLKKIAPKSNLDTNKCRDIYRSISSSDYSLRELEGAVLSLVSYAKQAAVGITTTLDDDSAWETLIDHFNVDTLGKDSVVICQAKKVLRMSIKSFEAIIDFDDMIYMPLLKKAVIGTYDWVLLDEAQDTNATRRLLSLAMMKIGGRLVAVGDKFQAIYGFTGADSNALDLIQAATGAICLPLSVTYRCPVSIVKEAQKYVPHIEHHENAPVGIVRKLASTGELFDEVQKGDVILCRYNAPIIDLVYRFIVQGIPARIEGKDISTNLKTLAKKWKSKDFPTFVERLHAFREKEVKRYKAQGKLNLVEVTQDKVYCLLTIIKRVVAKGLRGMPCDVICSEIDAIFGEVPTEGCITLSSIHRAKGCEWKKVYWLTTDISKRPMMAWEKQTEQNLRYVAITRAIAELVMVPADKPNAKSEDIETAEYA